MSARGLTPYGDTSAETFMGMELDLLDPQPSAIHIRDISVGLGNLCRFTGQVRRFYSVAEHSVLVSDLLTVMGHPELRLKGLLHDAGEAYIGDMSAPIKRMMRAFSIELDYRNPEAVGKTGYDILSDSIDRTIERAFDFVVSDAEHTLIKRADYWALRVEAAALTRSRGKFWSWPEGTPDRLPEGVKWRGGLPPAEASMLFEMKWDELHG